MSAEYERLLEGKTNTELKDELQSVFEPHSRGNFIDTDKLIAIQREYDYRDLDYFVDLEDVENKVGY